MMSTRDERRIPTSPGGMPRESANKEKKEKRFPVPIAVITRKTTTPRIAGIFYIERYEIEGRCWVSK